MRPILDLRFLNKFIRTQNFKMTSLQEVLPQLQTGDFMVTIDLKDAYLHIPMNRKHKHMLRFTIGESHYQFTTLAFGLKSAPRVFTKCLAAVAAHLRRQGIHVYPYLDDWLVKANSYQKCKQHAHTVTSTLISLGFSIHWKKSSMEPEQVKIFLGAQINTLQGKVFPSEKRARALVKETRLYRKGQARTVRTCEQDHGHDGIVHPPGTKCTTPHETHSRMATGAMVTSYRRLGGSSGCNARSAEGDGMVDHEEHNKGKASNAPNANSDHHHRRIPEGMGCSHGGAQGEGTVDANRCGKAHQLPRIEDHLPCTESLSNKTVQTQGVDTNRQHHCDVLHQQAGGHTVSPAFNAGAGDMEMGHPSQDRPASHTPTREGQHTSRLAQQADICIPRVGAQCSGDKVPV
ncbi:uncharacterized protein LOC144781565 [Lissotriton helveticus]